MILRTTYGVYEGVYLQAGKYQVDNSVAIQAWNRQDGPIATLTVCLCDKSLGKGEAYIDTNNCPWALDFIKENKLGEPTGKWRKSGFCTYPAVKFNTEQLRLCGMEE